MLPLQGLLPDDAYELATHLLSNLNIDRAKAPYAELRDLLTQLDNHPLAIQLVLPALQTTPLDRIRSDFAALLPTFMDDQDSGRNRSLLASLAYSLQRLSEEQRTLLPRLAFFEGGANEMSLLEITEIPEQGWPSLRQDLQQAALLVPEQIIGTLPFLRFHPVLLPFLRNQSGANDVALRTRYTKHYYALALFLGLEDAPNPQLMRTLTQKELPNLRHALTLLLQEGELDNATKMADIVINFLYDFGLLRERDELRQRVNTAVTRQQTEQQAELTRAEWLHEKGLGEDEYKRGNLHAARMRFEELLARIEAQPEGTPLGRGSYEPGNILYRLACCFRSAGQPSEAERFLRRALLIIDALPKEQSENISQSRLRDHLLIELGSISLMQGNYVQSQTTLEEALEVSKRIGGIRDQAIILSELGTVAWRQRAYAAAKERYTEALKLFQSLSEPEAQSGIWHNLGNIALEKQSWSEAEQCYRTSLAISEQLGSWTDAAVTCQQLAQMALKTDRPDEAEGWFKRALELDKRVHPESADTL